MGLSDGLTSFDGTAGSQTRYYQNNDLIAASRQRDFTSNKEGSSVYNSDGGRVPDMIDDGNSDPARSFSLLSLPRRTKLPDGTATTTTATLCEASVTSG